MHPLGNLCPNEYPITVHRQDNFEEGQEYQEQVKDDDYFSVCSDWDADLEEKDWKNLEEQKNNDNKTPHPSPKPTSVDTTTLQPSKPAINWFGNQISASSEETLEDVN